MWGNREGESVSHSMMRQWELASVGWSHSQAQFARTGLIPRLSKFTI